MHKTAGLLFLISGAIIVLGILTAEILYPEPYSISQNMISNLGSTPPPGSIIYQVPATIFDSSLSLSGLLILIGSFLLLKVKKDTYVFSSLAVMGAGIFAVGIFPAFHVLAHPISALVAFLGGGIAAILSSRITKPPFSYVSIILGSITLLFLFTGLAMPRLIVPSFGIGGTERWVFYPLVIWFIGFGGYLMGGDK